MPPPAAPSPLSNNPEHPWRSPDARTRATPRTARQASRDLPVPWRLRRAARSAPSRGPPPAPASPRRSPASSFACPSLFNDRVDRLVESPVSASRRCQHVADPRCPTHPVLCHRDEMRRPIPTHPVIPAKPGIHIGWPWRAFGTFAFVDPRLRGDDAALTMAAPIRTRPLGTPRTVLNVLNFRAPHLRARDVVTFATLGARS